MQYLAKKQINIYYFIIGLGPALKEIKVDLSAKRGMLMDKCRKAGVHFFVMNLCSQKGEYRVKEIIKITYVGEKDDV